MRFSLLEHPFLYEAQSRSETFHPRPYTGDLFAFRHEEMARQEPEKALWHRRIAKLEKLPILGWLAAKAEKLFVYIFAASNDHQKMRRNFTDALKDHAGPDVAQKNQMTKAPLAPFWVKTSTAEDQGSRRTMEDAHSIKIDSAAVFDGHLGTQVARFAADKIPHLIHPALPRVQARRNFSWLQTQIEKNSTLDNEGATGCLVQIYTNKGTVVTSTLGDTHAFIYRRINGKLMAIPLSPKRDWSHPKEVARAKTFDEKFKPSDELKPRFIGLQASRGLGDAGAKDENDRHFISHKPKVTEAPLHLNDIIVIATDGLWDNKSHKEIIQALDTDSKNPAQQILDTLKPFDSKQDNVTIVALEILPLNLAD